MSDSGQEMKVYLVCVESGPHLKSSFFYPQPFARRSSAEQWAMKTHKEGDFRVVGFRVRG